MAGVECVTEPDYRDRPSWRCDGYRCVPTPRPWLGTAARLAELALARETE